ncbi:MAG: NADH-quinone oxidoreductase subunit C [Mycobacteriales bacterium]
MSDDRPAQPRNLGHPEREESTVEQTTVDEGQPGVQRPRSAGGPPPAPVRHGMFGVTGTGDTSGYGGLRKRGAVPLPTQRPYGGYFDEVVDAISAAYPAYPETVQSVVVDRGEITLYVRKESIADLAKAMRDDPALRFELLASLSGVDYGPGPDDPGVEGERIGSADPDRLHVCYHLLSMTYRRRLRLEVAASDADPHVPTVTGVYPTADWQERETYDMFGVIFDGHPALTRILMPDDWDGHPQRKDYPLGGISVEYKGAHIPPPDERRAYR